MAIANTLKTTYKVAFIVLMFSFLFGIGFSVKHAAAAPTCQDGTTAPQNVLVNGSEASFCASHGGLYNTAKCANGTPIPQSVLVNGSEASFCASNGGPAGGTDPNAPSGPMPVNCNATPDNAEACILPPESTALEKCEGEESTACGFFEYINLAIKLLSAAIGLVATGMIILGGIQYSAAGGDPNAVQKAKGLIFKGVFALIGFGLIFAVAEWLLPGGIL